MTCAWPRRTSGGGWSTGCATSSRPCPRLRPCSGRIRSAAGMPRSPSTPGCRPASSAIWSTRSTPSSTARSAKAARCPAPSTSASGRSCSSSWAARMSSRGEAACRAGPRERRPRRGAAALDLVNGLRHLAEYFLLRIPAGGEVGLTASIVREFGVPDGGPPRPVGVRPQPRGRRKERPYAVFGGSRAASPRPRWTRSRCVVSFGLQGGRIGNLNVLGEVLSSARGAAFINRAASGGTTVEAAFPVSL